MHEGRRPSFELHQDIELRAATTGAESEVHAGLNQLHSALCGLEGIILRMNFEAAYSQDQLDGEAEREIFANTDIHGESDLHRAELMSMIRTLKRQTAKLQGDARVVMDKVMSEQEVIRRAKVKTAKKKK